MKLSSVLSVLLLPLFLIACEDEPPTDYTEELVFTGYIYVGEPVMQVTLTRSLGVTDTFDFAKAEIDDAVIQIWSDIDTIALRYEKLEDAVVGRYRAVDTTKLIAPETTYSMRAELADGKVLTSRTTTPGVVKWLRPPPAMLQYPKDTIDLPPSSDTLIWTPVDGVQEYLVSVEAVDTLDYGKYLEPKTAEQNRRIERFFEADAPRYDERTRWAFLQNTQVTVVWFIFKWFGRNDVIVYAPDPQLLKWFKQVRYSGNQLDPLLSNIEGGVGVFGSASRDSQESFVIKNQP